jgi:hypothetical protein
MKPWSDFYDLLSPDVPGCPQAAQEQALRQAAIAFCEQSLAWRYVHPDITVTVDTADYDFVPPPQAVVEAITYAKFNDTELSVNVSQDDMRVWHWRDQAGMPAYVLGGATSLKLVPNPDVEGTLYLEVILKPSPSAESIDDDLYNEFRAPIIHWALSQLMLSPNKPYSNPTLATFHMQQYFSLAAAAGIKIARNRTREPLQTAIMRRGLYES